MFYNVLTWGLSKYYPQKTLRTPHLVIPIALIVKQ